MATAAGFANGSGVLLRHLPAVYQEQLGNLAQFLEAYESILLSNGDRGIEHSISQLHSYLDPQETVPEFLPWLARWLALTLWADLDVAKQRELVARIVPIYQWWGTRKGLVDVLALLTGGTPSIVEPDSVALEVGRAIVGLTTRLGHERPHFFQVRLELSASFDPAARPRVERLAREVIELAKPAHTYYSLEIASGSSAPPTRGETH